MTPFYVIQNRPNQKAGYFRGRTDLPRFSLMSAECNCVLEPAHYGKRPTEEQIAALRAEYEGKGVRDLDITTCGVYSKRAAIRAAVATISSDNVLDYQPTIKCIGGKIKREVRKVSHFDIKQRNRKSDYTGYHSWFSAWENVKTRAEARQKVKDQGDQSAGWEYKIIPVYADAV